MKKIHNKGIINTRNSLLYVIPVLAVYAICTFVPLIQDIYYSFTDWKLESMTYGFVGIKNYLRIFRDGVFLTALKNTLILTFSVAILQNAFSLLVAAILNSKYFVGRNFCRAMIYIPVLISTMVLGYMWKLLLNPFRGPLKMILTAFGIKNLANYNVFSDSTMAFAVIIFTMVWHYIGYNMVIYLAGMQNVPPEIYESADIDGAGPVRKFFSITFPMIMPSVTTNLFINLIGCMKCFEYVYVMTSGGPNHATETLATYMYNTSFGQSQPAYGCAISVVLFVLIAIIAVAQVKFTRSKEVEA